jgi:hypothetical protein
MHDNLLRGLRDETLTLTEFKQHIVVYHEILKSPGKIKRFLERVETFRTELNAFSLENQILDAGLLFDGKSFQLSEASSSSTRLEEGARREERETDPRGDTVAVSPSSVTLP